MLNMLNQVFFLHLVRTVSEIICLKLIKASLFVKEWTLMKRLEKSYKLLFYFKSGRECIVCLISFQNVVLWAVYTVIFITEYQLKDCQLTPPTLL